MNKRYRCPECKGPVAEWRDKRGNVALIECLDRVTCRSVMAFNKAAAGVVAGLVKDGLARVAGKPQ